MTTSNEETHEKIIDEITTKAVLDITGNDKIVGWRGLGFRRYMELESAIYGFLMEHAIVEDNL